MPPPCPGDVVLDAAPQPLREEGRESQHEQVHVSCEDWQGAGELLDLYFVRLPHHLLGPGLLQGWQVPEASWAFKPTPAPKVLNCFMHCCCFSPWAPWGPTDRFVLHPTAVCSFKA